MNHKLICDTSVVDKPLPPLPGLSSSATRKTYSLDSGYASASSTPSRFSAVSSLPGTKFKIFGIDASDHERKRFADIKEFVEKDLRDIYASARLVSAGPISMRLALLGETKETARTRIVVFCDKSLVKKVRGYFQQPQIAEQCHIACAGNTNRCFDVIVSERQLNYLAGSTVREDQTLFVRGSDNSRKTERTTLCGTPARFGDVDTGPLTTIGGLISLVKGHSADICALTVGHIVPQATIKRWSSQSQESLELGVGDGGYEPDAEIEFMDGPEEQYYGSEVKRRLEALQQPPYNKAFGKLLLSSYSGCDIERQGASDWAIFNVPDDDYYVNRLQQEHKSGLTGSSGLCRGATSIGVFVSSSIAHTLPPDHWNGSRDVLIPSGQSGLVRGTLSADCAYIPLGPLSLLQRCFLFMPSPSHSGHSSTSGTPPFQHNLPPRFVRGDCGSWVIDANTFEVYGHVVASDGFGDSYVVPIVDVFRDISAVQAVDRVEFPSEEKIAKWRSQQQQSSHQKWKTSKPRPQQLSLSSEALRDDPLLSPVVDSGYASASSITSNPDAVLASDDEISPSKAAAKASSLILKRIHATSTTNSPAQK